jgi:hypothetical protein
VHGRDGWELADYDWDPETGLARLTYERPATGQVYERVELQPATPDHQGWATGRLNLKF